VIAEIIAAATGYEQSNRTHLPLGAPVFLGVHDAWVRTAQAWRTWLA
jgi:hypothetical protein